MFDFVKDAADAVGDFAEDAVDSVVDVTSEVTDTMANIQKSGALDDIVKNASTIATRPIAAGMELSGTAVGTATGTIGEGFAGSIQNVMPGILEAGLGVMGAPFGLSSGTMGMILMGLLLLIVVFVLFMVFR